MNQPLTFDPNEYDYGPATSAIRKIIFEWVEIDWFTPSGAPDEQVTRAFEDHNALAHRHSPEVFPQRVTARCVSGGWSEFAAWCKRVQDQTRWDWRFSILKTLSNDHAKARGWTIDSHAVHVPQRQPSPGDLFVRFDDAHGTPLLIWNDVFSGSLPFQTISDATAQKSAGFYFGHARTDVFNCVQWQLAEGHDDLTANPFFALARCYRLGGHPFSLDRDTVILFRFTADERLLPTATLLPTRR